MDDQLRHLDDRKGVEASPLMYRTEDGSLNEHPEFTAMKLLEERSDDQRHPSEILDLNNHKNYYKYGWMGHNDQEVTLNINTVLCGLLAVSLLSFYLIAGTKLLRFLQFFLVEKRFTQLSFSVSLAPPGSPAENEIPMTPKTPVTHNKCNDSSNPAIASRLVMQKQRRDAEGSRMCPGLLLFHSKSLMQFYAPLLCTTLQLACCSKSVRLPRYVVCFQLVLRVAVLGTTTMAACVVYLMHSLDEKDSKCLLNRKLMDSAYICLNELEESNGASESTSSKHRLVLCAIGAICSGFTALLMLQLSHGIFRAFSSYLGKLLRFREEDDGVRNDFGFFIATSGSCKKSKSRSKQKNPKSPLKRKKKLGRKSPVLPSGTHDSVTSFRALLERESDMSARQQLMLGGVTHGDESGYESGAGHLSMSTQANLVNMSTASNQATAREGAALATRKYQAEGPDLLPIDEDIDDEKCSPVKPKKRTSEDSPFKRRIKNENFENNGRRNEHTSSQNGKKPRIDQISISAISDVEQEKSGGKRMANSQSGYAGGDSGRVASSNRGSCSKGPISSFLDQHQDDGRNGEELSHSHDGSSGFQIEVEKIFEKKLEFSPNHSRQSETLEDLREPPAARIATKSHLKVPSLNVASCNVAEEGLVGTQPFQLLTLGHDKPESTRNVKTHGHAFAMDTMHPASVDQNGLVETIGINSGGENRPPNFFSQEEDLQEVKAVPFVQNFDILSSDRLSNFERPRSSSRRMQRRAKAGLNDSNRLPAGFTKAQAPKDSTSLCQKTKMASLTLAVMSLVFGLCVDVCFAQSLTDEALKCVLLSFAAAFTTDTVFQLLFIVGLSALQTRREQRSHDLILDTNLLNRMTDEAQALACELFTKYREQSATEKIEFKDQDDLMVEKIMRRQIGVVASASAALSDQESNCVSFSSNSKVIGPNDTLVREAVTSLVLSKGSFKVEVTETIHFRPPETSAAGARRHDSVQNLTNRQKSEAAPHAGINAIQPYSAGTSFSEQQARSGNIVAQDLLAESSNRQNKMSLKARLDCSVFERTQQFFAESKHVAVQHLQSKKHSLDAQKRSVAKQKKLKSSAVEVELEQNARDGREADLTDSKAFKKVKSQTPERANEAGESSSLLQQLPADHQNSSSAHLKQEGQFETPRATVSQVKLRRHGSVGDEECGPRQATIGLKQLEFRRSSQRSIVNSIDLASKLSSIKNHDYDRDEEDDEGSKIQAGQDMIEEPGSAALRDSVNSGCLVGGRSMQKGDDGGRSLARHASDISKTSSAGKIDQTCADHFKSFDSQKEHRDGADQKYFVTQEKKVGQVTPQESRDAIIARYNSQEQDLNEIEESHHVGNQATTEEVQKEVSTPGSRVEPQTTHKNFNAAAEVQHINQASTIENGQAKDLVSQKGPVELPKKQSSRVSDRKRHQSSAKKATGTIPVSHRSLVSKQQSFNSPRSLADTMSKQSNGQLRNSINNSSVCKGRRKMILLDEAAISQQSLHFGSNKDEVAASEVEHSQLRKFVKTAAAGRRIQDSQEVLFDKNCDQAKPDFQKEHVIDGGDENREQEANAHGLGSSPVGSQAQAQKQSTTTSAFERLLQASKRIAKKKKSSEKKGDLRDSVDRIEKGSKYGGENSIRKLTGVAAQVRSVSQCTDTLAIMRDQTQQYQVGNSAIFAQPFKITSKKERKSTSNPLAQQCAAGDSRVKQSNEEGSRQMHYDSVSLPRCQAPNDGNQSQLQQGKTELTNQESPSRSFRGRSSAAIVTEQDKIKKQEEGADFSLKIDRVLDKIKAQGIRDRKNSELPSQRNPCNLLELPNRKDKKIRKGFRPRSRNSSPNGSHRGSASREDSFGLSHATLEISKDPGGSSDGNDQRRVRREQSDYYYRLSRLQDQRERLVSFLSLAQQAKSKKDITRISNLIAQIDETGKPLPLSRINELKTLDLMTSPYNQSLIAMMHVELALYKKVKEMKKAEQRSRQQLKSDQASKFSVPKFSRVLANKSQDSSSNNNRFEHSRDLNNRSAMQIDTGYNPIALSNQGISYKPQGMLSQKSNQVRNNSNDLQMASSVSFAPQMKNSHTTTNAARQAPNQSLTQIDKKQPAVKIQHLVVSTRRANQISPLSQSFLHSSQSNVTTPANRTASQLARPIFLQNLPATGNLDYEANDSGMKMEAHNPESHSEHSMQPIVRKFDPSQIQRGNTVLSFHERYAPTGGPAQQAKPQPFITPIMQNKNSQIFSGRQKQNGISELVLAQMKYQPVGTSATSKAVDAADYPQPKRSQTALGSAHEKENQIQPSSQL